MSGCATVWLHNIAVKSDKTWFHFKLITRFFVNTAILQWFFGWQNQYLAVAFKAVLRDAIIMIKSLIWIFLQKTHNHSPSNNVKSGLLNKELASAVLGIGGL